MMASTRAAVALPWSSVSVVAVVVADEVRAVSASGHVATLARGAAVDHVPPLSVADSTRLP